MKKPYFKFKKIYPKSEIRESCICGSDCDGICKQKYYDICKIHQKYYYEYQEHKKVKIFVKESENVKNNDRY